MKKTVVFLTSLLVLLACSLFAADAAENAKAAPQKGELAVQCSPDLYPLMSQWVSEYGRTHPDNKVRLSALSSTPNVQLNLGLSFVSGVSGSAWHMIVGKDAYVPVFNANNPLKPAIGQQGITAAAMALALTSTDKDWKMLVKEGQSVALNFYMLKSEADMALISGYLGIEPSAIKAIVLDNESDMIARIGSDPSGIGFISMSALMHKDQTGIPAGLSLLPIDKNANGRLDYAEKIYDDPQTFLRGAWIGKFPKALCRNIYCSAQQKPAGDAELAFLTWVLGAGQDILASRAYVDLAYNDRQSKIDDLQGKEAVMAPSAGISLSKWLLIAAGVLLILGIGVTELSRSISRRRKPVPDTLKPGKSVLDEKSVEVMAGLYFDKSHTWSFMEKSGVVRVGIDDFIQHITGPLTRIKMKKPGEHFEKGETFISIIQNGKQLNIKAPFSGVVKSQNSLLYDNTHLINKSPYSEGWVYLVEPQNWSRETSLLLMADRYKEWLKSEFTRLKDFLAVSLKANNVSYSPIILQDGGALNDNILAELGPEIWEDFQTSFIDKTK